MKRRSHAPPRHASRRAALQVLYALDLSRGRADDAEPVAVADVFARVAEHFDLVEGARAFAWEIVEGVDRHRDALDARIGLHARNWRLDRMAAVDRNVLRIATWEIDHTDTPDRVVIDEAIELARDFGSDRSPAFVNGVLDAISRDPHDAETPAPGPPESRP